MPTLWQAHEPAETELGDRAEMAMRFSFMNDVWVDSIRHDPDHCVCYLLGVFFNHVERDSVRQPCDCSGCREVRRRWKSTGRKS